jgi:hypothetical protein
MTQDKILAVSQKVDDLIFVCGRLSTLLDKEAIALERQRPEDIDVLLKEKDMLCRLYESRGKAVLKDIEILKAVDADLRANLLDLVQDVEQKIVENTRQLAIQIEVNRKFFSVLALAAREHTPKSGAYSNSGLIDEGHNPVSKGMPLSIDQSL